MKAKFSIVLSSLFVLAACGDDAKHDAGHPAGTHTHADGTVHKNESGGGHGPLESLGSIQLGGITVKVSQEGEVEAGKEVGVDLSFAEGTAVPGAVRAWIGVETAVGSMKAKLGKEGDHGMHGHLEAPKPLPAGSKFWFEVEGAEGVSKASLAFK